MVFSCTEFRTAHLTETMSSYDADCKYPESGALDTFYCHAFQIPKKGEGAEPTEMDHAEAYGESMIEQWPPCPNEGPGPPTSTMFTPMMPQYGANGGVSYNAYNVPGEEAVFPEIPNSHCAVQSGLQLDQPHIDQQLQLQRLAEYSSQMSASH